MTSHYSDRFFHRGAATAPPVVLRTFALLGGYGAMREVLYSRDWGTLW